MKEYLAKRKKTFISLGIAILAAAAVSVLSLLLFMAFDIIYFDDGIQFNSHLFDSFKNSWYGWIVFVLLQMVFTSLLCFIPGASMAFILLSRTLYDTAWQAFILSFVSVMLCSAILYVIGRFGGYKVCSKILGEEDCMKASQLLNDKGVIFFPIMMMFPVFPDDALVMIAGTLKMSLRWFIPSIILGRGIGIVTIIFGLSLVPFDKFTSIWHWIGFILICALLIALVFYLAHRLNKYLHKHKEQ